MAETLRAYGIKMLMAESHRQILLTRIPEGGNFFEWGSGGTSLWLCDNLPERSIMASVESDKEWFNKINAIRSARPTMTARWNYELAGDDSWIRGKNAHPHEETPAGLEQYICRREATDADVILVDGVARGACLAWALSVCKPYATIFLHDAGRNWYAWAVTLAEYQGWKTTMIPFMPGEYPAQLMMIEKKSQ